MESTSPSKGQAMMNFHREELKEIKEETHGEIDIKGPVLCPRKKCDGWMYYFDEGDSLICYKCSTSFECSREELKRRLE